MSDNNMFNTAPDVHMSGEMHDAAAADAITNADANTSTSQQPALPQRFPTQQAPKTYQPRTPFPLQADKIRDAFRPRDPNPRIGSMHNVGPPMRGPPFPMTRRPIYFPSSLCRHPNAALTPVNDVSSPPPGSKSLQKGRPQKVWRDLIDTNSQNDEKERKKTPRETAAAQKLAQHIKEYEARRAQFVPPRSRETVRRFKVQKRPRFNRRQHAMPTVPETFEPASPLLARHNPLGRQTPRSEVLVYGSRRPTFARDASSPSIPFPLRPIRHESQPPLAANPDGTAPTMTVDNPVVHSHIFQTEQNPQFHEARQVSNQQDAIPTMTGAAPVQETPVAHGALLPEDVPRDADQDVIMSDADETEQVDYAQHSAAAIPLAQSADDSAMADAPEIPTEAQQFVPSPVVQQEAYDPFRSVWNGAYADHLSGRPVFGAARANHVPAANPGPNPTPETPTLQSSLLISQFGPPPQARLIQQATGGNPAEEHHAGLSLETYEDLSSLQSSRLFASQRNLTRPFPATATPRMRGEDTIMLSEDTPLLVRKRRIDEVEDPEQVEHASESGPVAINAEDAMIDDVEVAAQNSRGATHEPVSVPASPTGPFVPGMYPSTPAPSGRVNNAMAIEDETQPEAPAEPYQFTGILIAQARDFFSGLFEDLRRQFFQCIGNGIRIGCSTASQAVRKVFNSVKRRAVEFCRTSSTSDRRRRRRSSRAQRDAELMRCLTPEQRHREKARRRRSGMMSQSSAARRSQQAGFENQSAQPDAQVHAVVPSRAPTQEAVAPIVQVEEAVAQATPQVEPPSTATIFDRNGLTQEQATQIQQANNMFTMSAEEYLEREAEMGIHYDNDVPPTSRRETPEPEEADSAAGRSEEAQQPSQEDHYEGFPTVPQQASSSLRSDWTGDESFPRGACSTTATALTETSTESRGGQSQTLGQQQTVGSEDRTPRHRDGPLVMALTATWESRLQTAMESPESRQLATTLSGDPLTRRDLATCCDPLAWLNDEIINAYLGHTVQYARKRAGNAGRNDPPKYHAFNSFFYSNLRDKGYESVRRWASRAKIGGSALLQTDAVFIPIHDHMHWTLMVVKPTARTIEHFDSLGHPSAVHSSRVKTWLRGELGNLFNEEEWRVLPTASPQQNNGSDCGVFLLTTAKLVALDMPLKYGARDIPEIRKRIAAELINGGFDGDFDPEAEFPIKSVL